MDICSENWGKSLTQAELKQIEKLKTELSYPEYSMLVLTGATLSVLPTDHLDMEVLVKGKDILRLKNFQPSQTWNLFTQEELADAIRVAISILELNIAEMTTYTFGLYENLNIHFKQLCEANNITRGVVTTKRMTPYERACMARWLVYDDYMLEENIGSFFARRPGFFKDCGFSSAPLTDKQYDKYLDIILEESSTGQLHNFLCKKYQ